MARDRAKARNMAKARLGLQTMARDRAGARDTDHG